MRWTKRWRRRLRALARRDAVEREMDEELAFHLEMETRKNLRAGMRPEEARRQALIAFGGVDRHKEGVRDARWLSWANGLSLDLRLGVRMLARYPWLTLVGGLAMAFAIFVGAGTFHFVNQLLDPTLPLPGGERIVGLRYWDRAGNEEELPLPDDLRTWREELRTVEDLGAFQTLEPNLSVGGEPGEPARVARISPAGFRVAGVRPLLGRTLVEADAEPGAPPAVVLGHALWRTRLGGDPSVVGRTVRLGGEEATVVGVMPEGFAFPRDHALWQPLRPGEPGSGAALRVFGRLAPGATLEEAQTEAAALEARVARAAPERREHRGAQVLPFTESLSSLRVGLVVRVMVLQLNLFAGLFLVLVSANVALLMFARAATREGELVVRSALGASRGRIVAQLFAEALVLAALATVLGLAATGPALAWVQGQLRELGGELPFWFDPRVSAGTALYAGLLALVGAAVAGVVPALKATGRGMRTRLQQVGAGAGGLRLGGIWTWVILTQVAATVAFTGVGYVLARQAARSASVEAYFPAAQYLGVRVEMDGEPGARDADTTREAFRRRYAARVRELERRIAGHPAVAGVTLARHLPIKSHASALVETDEARPGAPSPGTAAREVFSDAVDPGFFGVLGAPVLSGRAFDPRDLEKESRSVVVNASFVEEVLGGRNAVGRRLRYVSRDGTGEPGPWHEIVGVVRDLTAERSDPLDLDHPTGGRVYHPLELGGAAAYPVHLVAHVRGSPGALVPALHRTAQAVGPELRIHEPLTLDRANSDLASLWRLYASLILVVSAIALSLSLAAIYAVTSFAVARRTREIGVRVALGARPRRVVAEVLGRPLVQVAAGVAAGCLLAGAAVWGLTDGRATARDGVLLVALGAGMLGVCSAACIGPTLRVLRVQPARALGAEV